MIFRSKKLQSENSQILNSNELDNSIKTKEETISSISLIKDEEVTPINPQNINKINEDDETFNSLKSRIDVLYFSYNSY